VGQVSSGVAESFVSAIAAQRRTHPAHAYTLIRQLKGHYHQLLVKLPDDPLLAAPYILDRLRECEGIQRELKAWAEAVNACDPADSPDHGARLR
jgi:hypothetical protein